MTKYLLWNICDLKIKYHMQFFITSIIANIQGVPLDRQPNQKVPPNAFYLLFPN